MKDSTLCYLFQDGKVLLQKKSSGRFGEGKWNAPGGKLRLGESPPAAAIREVREETGLEVKGVEEAGLLNFRDEAGKSFSVHVFTAQDFSGEVRGNEEGELQWFPTQELPFDQMWEDDRIWVPKLLKKEKFQGSFLFTRKFKKLISHQMEDGE